MTRKDYIILARALSDTRPDIRLTDNAVQWSRTMIAVADALKKSGQFPPTMIHMVAVGEKAGQLEQMLERVATTYESEVDAKLGRFTALLEPLMLVIMGGAVAFIVFSILQPIMDLGQLSGPK